MAKSHEANLQNNPYFIHVDIIITWGFNVCLGYIWHLNGFLIFIVTHVCYDLDPLSEVV